VSAWQAGGEISVCNGSRVSDQQLLLAIDTSTEQTGIALYNGSCLDDVSWSSCREHTILLLDEIDHQLRRAHQTVSSLSAVAVATGPGRFNALRVGMSIAKGLALALEIPIIGISTLEAIAWPERSAGRPVAAVLEAGRSRVSWQLFTSDVKHLSAVARNTSADEFISSIAGLPPGLCVTGELHPALADTLRAMPGVVVPPLAGRLGRAGAVAELAWQRFQLGDSDDLVGLEPVYLHAQRQSAAIRAAVDDLERSAHACT